MDNKIYVLVALVILLTGAFFVSAKKGGMPANPDKVKYACGDDPCSGYRCVDGNLVGRSCYASSELADASCAGTFEFIPQWDCSGEKYFLNYN